MIIPILSLMRLMEIISPLSVFSCPKSCFGGQFSGPNDGGEREREVGEGSSILGEEKIGGWDLKFFEAK